MSRYFFLVFGVIFGAALCPAQEAETGKDDKDSAYESIQVLARAMQLIRQDYVDEKKTSFKELTYSALRGMLSELDPHSQFMDPDGFKDMQEDTKSEFGGLGIVVTMRNGVLTIVNVAEDTPGFKAELMPGDQILKINGLSTEKLGLPDAIEHLRGEVGDKVKLTIQRPQSNNEIRDFEMIRAIIKVPSVKDAQILPSQNGEKIGYVRITQFNEPTVSELIRALEKLEKQGMQALVLDLRYNPGGLLNSAVDVSGLFLPADTKVASTEGRSPGREYRTSSLSGARRNYPLAVLVNYASASGSEVVAGALKDLKRAIIVGETTFGKGSVQSVISLPDGSALRLTTAKYFTPGRQVIHEHGVSPDIRIALTYDQETDLLRARRDIETGRAKTGAAPSDLQLDRAVDALRGTLIFVQRSAAKPQPAGKGS